MRIVSLLPSATEIICCIGLRQHLVGVTHECDYPADVIGLPVVTKTVIPHNTSSVVIDKLVRKQLEKNTALYSLNIELLQTLRPDIIVTQALCEVCAVSEAEITAAISYLPNQPKVINLEPMCLQDIFDTIDLLGKETEHEDAARATIGNLTKRLEKIRERTNNYIPKLKRPKVIFLEWLDPFFNAGHWTPELIEIAGGLSCLDNRNQPSTTISWQAIASSRPDVLFVACCGFSTQRAMHDLPILQSHQEWEELPCVRKHRVYFSDGNAYFNRPGPRLIDSLEIIANVLHPDVHALKRGLPPVTTISN